MTTKTALFALLAMWGVGALPAMAEDAAPADDDAAVAEEAGEGLTNRVWTKEEKEGDLPGVMRVFLSDGTLISDSCWETHRLSAWKQDGDTKISWDEDGMPINAEILSLTADELVLKLDLVGGAVEERYIAASVPYLCPDMPR